MKSEGELYETTSVGNSDITNHRAAKLYNLDVILAVGVNVGVYLFFVAFMII